MDEHEVVLSDVHINKFTDSKLPLHQLHFSRFVFTLNSESHFLDDNETNHLQVDDDGDIIVPTKITNNDVICIFHEMKSTLSNVGLQVWMGALFMCDYIADKREDFCDAKILELGSGVGLTGIFASQFASMVICTDYDENILELCQKNIEHNSIFFNRTNIITKKLDWFSFNEQYILSYSKDLPTSLIICDCVYDNELTDALFRTIYKIIQQCKQHLPVHSLKVYFSLEKRLNFTLDDRDVTCHQYDHFCDCIKQLSILCESNSYKINVNVVNCNEVPTCFKYRRVEQLELWIISVWSVGS